MKKIFSSWTSKIQKFFSTLEAYEEKFFFWWDEAISNEDYNTMDFVWFLLIVALIVGIILWKPPDINL